MQHGSLSEGQWNFIYPQALCTKTSPIWNAVRNEEKDKNKQKPGWGGKEKKINNKKRNPKPNEHATVLKEKQNPERLFMANTNATEPTPWFMGLLIGRPL